MAQYVFGSGYDSLAGQIAQRDAQAIALAERDQAMRQRAIEQGQENYRFAQQMAARDAERNQALEEARYRTALGLGEQRRQEGREDYRFGLARNDRADALKEDSRRYALEMGFKTREEEFRKNQLASGEGSRQLKELLGMADKGLLMDEADVSKLFPSLKPEQITWAKNFAKAEADEQVKQLQQIANEATQVVRAKQVGKNPAKPAGTGLLGTGLFAKSAVPTPQLAATDALNFLILDDALREYSGLLQWDEAAQAFTPRGLKQPTASPYPFAQTNTPSAVTNVPPPIAPTAGTTPYSFATGPAKPLAGTSRQAQGGYQIGASYRGLTYLGGDPNDQSSWITVR